MTSLPLLQSTLQTLFGKTADQLARRTGLVERASPLTGSLFLTIAVLGFIQNPQASYGYLAQFALDLGVSLSRQALQQRFVKKATVEFMHTMFQESLQALQQKITLPLSLLQPFGAVYVQDSTQVALPTHLSQPYPASGGSGPKAALKLQATFELLRGQISALFEQSARQSDQAWRSYLPPLARGSLVLFDLGYFVLATFEQLLAQHAYFVSRLSSQCVLWQADQTERFELIAFLQKAQTNLVDLDLALGAKAKIPVRVVALKLPAEVVAERRRKLNRKASQRGKAYSEARKAFLDYNIYVTNVPVEWLTSRQVVQVYELRWQVELLFKLCKHSAGLERVVGRREGRIIGEIYAKLIAVVLFEYLRGPVRWQGNGFELSEPKGYQTLQRRAVPLGQALLGQADLGQSLNQLCREWVQFDGKDKRRHRVSSLRQLALSGEAEAALLTQAA